MSHYTLKEYQRAEERGEFECPLDSCSYATPSWKGLAVHFGKSHEGKLGPVSYRCETCGSWDARNPSNITGESLHCSNGCQAKWMSDSWQGENSPIWNQENVSCTHCGGRLSRMQSELNDSGIYFCNAGCQGEYYSGENNYAWAGGHEYLYGSGWRKQRRKALERDGYVCQLCDRTQEEELNRRGKGLEVHHIIPFRTFGIENHEEANRLDNLTTLCRECHLDVEYGDATLN